MGIDINCDMGESFGDVIIGDDQGIMPYISSANIACGFHGGDPAVIADTIKLALKHRVAIGAHPSYPDREGFGRVEMTLDKHTFESILVYQIGAIKSIASYHGARLNHVKLHGAMYHAVHADTELSKIFVGVVRNMDPAIKVYGMKGTVLGDICKSNEVTFFNEVFADRSYEASGKLVPRDRPQAVISDKVDIAERMIRVLTEKSIETVSGELIEMEADTICIHGDHPGAIEVASYLNQSLRDKWHNN